MNSDQLETTKETTIEKSNAKYGHVPAKKKAKLSSNRDVDGSIDGVENSLSDTKHGHGGCHFYLSTKSRYCPQQVKEGRKYCPHHASAIPTPAKETKEPTEAHGIRVPCPYDPTHGVFVYKLQRHLQVCNKRPIERHDPFYACDLNAGEDSEDDETMKPTSDPKTDLQELIASAKAHGEANGSGVEQPVRRLKKKQTESLLHKLSGTQIMDLVKKVETLAAEILPPIGDDFTDSQECLRAFGSLEGRNMKHISQISHMISIMQKHNMCTPDTVCLEFGAGKGTLSQMIHTVFKCGTLLIDRKGFRQKVDRFERQNEGFQRIKIDIKDLNLAGVDSISHKPVIAVGKHLCGCATDLTLRCFHTHPRSQIDGLVHGVCIALCCHHICNWKSYVNKEYVKNVLQLTRDEFEILCKMTSWAVCGSRGALNLDKRNPASPKATQNISEKGTVQDGDDDSIDSSSEDDEEANKEGLDHSSWSQLTAKDQEGIFESLTREVQERVGYKAKRLLDYGRVLYLEKLGFEASLIRYCETKHSPENILLFAHTQKGKVTAPISKLVGDQ